MRKWKILTGVVVAVVVGYLAASPYITVHQMQSAAEARNGDALADHIDFPSVRQSLKDQLNAKMLKEASKSGDDDPAAALGATFAGAIVEKMVDAYVTPAGIRKMMEGQEVTAEDTASDSVDNATAQVASGSATDDPLANASLSYQSLNKFVVTTVNDSGEEVRLVMRRQGLNWKMTAIQLPLDG